MAREMSVRTFCAPDSMIKKHMHDFYKVLEMLGAPAVTYLAFQQLQVSALKIMKRKSREELPGKDAGIAKKWEPEKMVPDEENPFL